MSTVTQSSAIYKALALAQKSMKHVAKSGDNKFDKYRYATLEDFVDASGPALAEQKFALLSSVEEIIPLEDRTTKAGGTEHCIRVKMSFTLLHESGERLSAQCFGEGQDRADKALYKAITGCRKYGLASMLNLATSDDPEADETVGTTDPSKPKRTPAPKVSAKPATQPRTMIDDITDLIAKADTNQKCDKAAAYIESKAAAEKLSKPQADVLQAMLVEHQKEINHSLYQSPSDTEMNNQLQTEPAGVQ